MRSPRLSSVALTALACVGAGAVLALIAVACASGTAPSSVTPPAAPPPPPPPPSPPPAPPSPPVQRVVFDMQAPGTGWRSIYAVALDGSAPVAVTRDTADHHAPSAYDSLVVFGSARTVGTIVAAVRSAGGASTETLGAADAPALSPDGTQLTFVSFAGPLPRVSIATSDGSNLHRLVAADGGWDGAIESHPVWAPTNDRIAYVSTRNGNPAVFVAAISGATGSAALVSGAASGASVEPAWSPDGTQIVFASNRDGPTDLYVTTLANGAVARLTQLGHVGQPTWLHDGKIVFTQWTGSAAGLAWLEPTAPTVVHSIATPGDAQHPAAYP